MTRYVCCLLFLSILAGDARAQSTSFDQLEIAVSPSINLNRNFLHSFWDVSPGAELRVATRFHGGYLEAGLRYEQFSPSADELPGFDAILVQVGWGARLEPARWLDVSLGVRAGNLRMSFDEQALSGVRTENELTLGGTARVDIWLARHVGIFVAGSYSKTFTFVRLNLYHATAGLAVRLSTPLWLRRLLA